MMTRLLCVALALTFAGCLEEVEDPRPERRSPIPDGGLFDPGQRPGGGSGYGSGSGGSGSGSAGGSGSGRGSGMSQGSGALRVETDAGVDAAPPVGA